MISVECFAELNTPSQLKNIYEAILAIPGGGGTPSNAEADIAFSEASGSIAAGYKSVTIIFSNDFDGEVFSVPFLGSYDTSITFTAPIGAVLNAIPYIINIGSIRILTTIIL